VEVGGWVRYYADVHRKARNGEGFRIAYTTDGISLSMQIALTGFRTDPETSYSSIRYS